jgi:hypothetical protein
VREWVCLEPDGELAARVAHRVAHRLLPASTAVITGTIGDLGPGEAFDAVLYLDVLEHIADDRAELACAAHHLAPGGRLIVLAPAHQSLFSPFDAAIGHFRRYDRASLAALTPPGCRLQRCAMLDSAGLLVSLANRWLLRADLPSRRQIALWDRVLVPVSRVLDRLTFHRLGKTVVAVWCRAG